MGGSQRDAVPEVFQQQEWTEDARCCLGGVGRDEKGYGMNTSKEISGSAQKTPCFQGMLPLGPHGQYLKP